MHPLLTQNFLLAYLFFHKVIFQDRIFYFIYFSTQPLHECIYKLSFNSGQLSCTLSEGYRVPNLHQIRISLCFNIKSVYGLTISLPADLYQVCWRTDNKSAGGLISRANMYTWWVCSNIRMIIIFL